MPSVEYGDKEESGATLCSFKTLSGLTLRGKAWGNASSENKILAVHGWLDNSNSFDKLIPLLIESCGKSLRIVCFDFPGHGWSDHKPPSAAYYTVGYLEDIADIADALEWSKFILMGHSLGAIVSALFTSISDRVEKLILIDSLVPRTFDASQLPGELKAYINDRSRMMSRKARYYASMNEYIERVKQSNPHIEEESIKILAKRGTEQTNEGIRFKHDARLGSFNSPFRYTKEQVCAFLKAIECPVLLFWGEKKFYDFELKNMIEFEQLIKNLTKYYIPGTGHHLHLDNPQCIYKEIITFLDEKPSTSP